MYSKKIKIAIVSENTDLENRLAQAMIPAETDVSFVTLPAAATLGNVRPDVLILDTADDDFAITTQFETSIRLVRCATPEQAALAARDERLEDIWFKPFNDALLQFQFGKLLARLLQAREYELNQNYLDTMINTVPDLIWFKRLDGIHLKVNDGFCRAVGKAKPDVEGHDHYHIWDIPKEVYENSEYVCLDTDTVILETHKPGVFDEMVAGKSGMRQLKTYKAPLFDQQGELIGTVGIAQDVTEFKNMDAKLELILRTMPFAVLIKDLNDRVIDANQKFEEFFQVNKDAIVGKPYNLQAAVADSAATPANLLYFKHDKEVRLRHDDHELILEIIKEPIYDYFDNCIGVLYIFRDVTVDRNFQEQLKAIAYTDQLTGLFTRRYLYEYMEKYMAASTINLLYIDLDNFKLINDTFGHHFGDEILKETGLMMQKIFPNDICVRMGGDEFLVAITGKASLASLREKANALIKTLKSRFPLFPKPQRFSVSIGIATVEGHSDIPLDELLHKSDQALYKAKSNGKSQCFVYSADTDENGEPDLQ